jgi:hypothetical protein
MMEPQEGPYFVFGGGGTLDQNLPLSVFKGREFGDGLMSLIFEL